MSIQVRPLVTIVTLLVVSFFTAPFTFQCMAASPDAGSQVALIDATLPDVDILVAALEPGVTPHLIDSEDPLLEIESVLSSYRQLSAVHLVSHGADGVLYVGGKTIDRRVLLERPSLASALGSALAPGGDILLYGCNLTRGERGLRFVHALAASVQRDVAASNDPTGATRLGGDWWLETQVGIVTASLLSDPDNPPCYPHTLDTFDFSTASGTGTVNQTVGSVTLTATTDTAQLSVWSGQAFDYANSGHYIDFAFSTAVDVTSFRVGFWGNVGFISNFTIQGFNGGTTYTYTVSPGYADLFEGGGSPIYTVNLSGANDWGEVTSIRVTANGGGTVAFDADDIVFTVSANTAPEYDDADDMLSLAVNEDSGAASFRTALAVTDGDAGQTLTWTQGTAPSKGSISIIGTAATPAGGAMPTTATYTPGANQSGADTFTVVVSDGTDTDTLTVNVTINDAPEVNSIVRADASPTNASSVDFSVTFSQSVTGVDTSDFTLSTTGTATGALFGLSGSGTTYTVTVSSLAGDGTLRLDLSDDDSILNTNSVPLGGMGTAGNGDGSYSAGQSYAVDRTAPTVTDANISISGASGTGGAFKVGDTVTATWNNTAGGDNNADIGSVTVDFSAFGGGAAVSASNSGGTWTATTAITEDGGGSIDAANRNVSVTATDNAGNATTTADTSNATVDNDSPVVTDGNISISGATGAGGTYVVGDTVTATWNDTAGGDNNADTIGSVTVDFSAFGGGAAVSASNSGGTWTAAYILTFSSSEGSNLNVALTATDNAGNGTTTADSSNATVDINQLPVIGNLDGDSVSFSIGGSAAALDAGANATLTDSDSADFSGGNVTVAITANLQAGEDVLAVGNAGAISVAGTTVLHADGGGITIGTVAGGGAGTDLVITLNAGATAARVQDLIRALQYMDTDAGTVNTASRTIRVTANDGDGGTSAAHIVTVSLVRAPIIDLDVSNPGGGFSGAFTENGGGVVLADADSSISDDGTFKSLTVTITNRPDGALESLSSTYGTGAQTVNGEAVTIGAYNPGTGVLLLTIDDGSATAATLEMLIESIRYNNTSDTPDTTSRTITFAATDNDDNTGASVSAVITVAAFNDPPAVGTNTGVTVNEGATATLTTAQLNENDPDDAGSGLTYTVTVVPVNGALKLNGTALTTSDTFTQDDIDNSRVTYTHDGSETVADGFTFSLADGGENGAAAVTGQTVAITVTPVNDVPAIGNLDSDTPSCLTGAGSTNVDENADATVNDPDSADFDTGVLVVTQTTGTANGSFGVDGTTVTSGGDGTLSAGESVAVSGTVIGTVDGADDGQAGNDLTIALNANANAAGITDLIRNLLYAAPSGVGDRTLNVTLSDGDGGTSAVTTVVISVADNTAPTASDSTIRMNWNTVHTFTPASFKFSDVDAGDSLQSVRIVTLPVAGALTLSGGAVSANQDIPVADIAAGNLTFTPLPNATGSPYAAFDFMVSDGTGYSPSAYTMTLNVNKMVSPLPATYRLSVDVTPAGAGTVSSSPAGISCGADCFQSFPRGTEVTLAATADEGHVFVGWSGAGTSGTGPVTVTMTDARSVTARFQAVPKQADLGVTVTADTQAPALNGLVTFTISARNSGPDVAFGVVVSDRLPTGLSYVSDDGAGAYTASTGTWTIGSMPSGSEARLHVVAKVTGTDIIVNTATIAGHSPTDPVSTNNAGSVTLGAGAVGADIGISLSVSPTSVIPGERVTVTLCVVNNGPDPATAVTAHATLWPALTGVTYRTAGMTAFAPWTGSLNLGELAAAATRTVWIRGTAETAMTDSPLTVSAAVAAGGPDPNMADNFASAELVLEAKTASADLALMMGAVPVDPVVGESFTLAIVLTNNGPDAAEQVVVQNLLLPGLSYVSHSGDGSYSPVTGIWHVGTLASDSLATLSMTATVDADGALTHKVYVAGSRAMDPLLANNSAAITVNADVLDIDLALDADLTGLYGADPNHLIAGDRLGFHLALTNNGTGPAVGAQVKVGLPPGMAVSDFTVSSGCFDPGSSIWYVDNPDACSTATAVSGIAGIRATFGGDGVVSGDTPTLDLVIEVVDASLITDGVISASIITDPDADPDTTNNSASRAVNTTEPFSTDLSVQIRPGAATAHAGDTTTYTVLVRNSGPDTASGIQVAVVVDPSYTYLRAAADQGTFDADTGLWTIGNLVAGDGCALVVTVTCETAVGETETIAFVDHVAEWDIDSHNDVAAATIATGTTYTVTFAAGPNGTVSGDLIQAVPAGGTTTTVTAIADAGFVFTGWTGDHTGTANPLVLSGVATDMTVTALFDAQASADADGDGIADAVEQGPAGDDPDYDGNADGVADRSQANVASLPTAEAGGYVTISTDTGAVVRVAMLPAVSVDPLPAGNRMTQGIYDLWVDGLPSGGSARITFRFHDAMPTPATVLAFGPDAFDPADHWYAASFATVTGTAIVYTCRDGGDGDSDLTPDGMLKLTTAPAWPTSSDVPDNSTSSGSGGSGCFIRSLFD